MSGGPAGPRLFFSYGMTKCGTTLAFHLTRRAMVTAGYGQPLNALSAAAGRRLNFVGHLSEADLDALLAEADALGHMLVLKTHTRPDPSVVRAIEDGRAIAHAIFRDPRDMALSMRDHGDRAREAGKAGFAEIFTLEDALSGIRGQMESLSAWLQLPGVRPLRFEDIAFETRTATQEILDQLGLAEDSDPIIAHVLGHEFIQFNKGVRDRHRADMGEGASARFQRVFAPFYRSLMGPTRPTPGPNGAVLPLGTVLHDGAEPATSLCGAAPRPPGPAPSNDHRQGPP